MKVISGKYKGRKIEGFDLEGTRPTMERIKESVFAMIQDDIKESIVLDLFSGSGNLGIEALSVGAAFTYFVDCNKKATNIIRKNLEIIGNSTYKILTMDYKKAIHYLKEEKITLDIIFLDPPYQTDYIKNSIQEIEDKKLLNKKGKIICESDSLDKIIYPSCYQAIKEKRYKDKWVVILQKIC